MMRPLLLALSLTAPITLHAQRKQVEVTVAGAPATTATRVQTIYADAQYAIERVEPTLIAAEVPLKRRDWGGAPARGPSSRRRCSRRAPTRRASC